MQKFTSASLPKTGWQNKSKDFSYFRSYKCISCSYKMYTFFTAYGQLLIWLSLPPTPNTYTMLPRIPIALHTSHSIYFLFKKYLFVWLHQVLRGILVPPPGIKSTFPALEGTFFTLGPPEKSPCMRAKLLQICPTLCDPTGCTPPGSSVHEILQAKQQSEFPCPPQGDLPDPVIQPESLFLLKKNNQSILIGG